MNVEIYRLLFINRSDIWFRQWIDLQHKCQYSAVKPGSKRYEPVSDELIWRHLAGKVTCSWPAVDEGGNSRWVCWDSDHESGEIERLQRLLANWGMPSYREAMRPGRDGHLWMFLSQPAPAGDLILFNQEAFAHGGVENDAVEFFPKSADRFSQVRGPLGVHRKPGANGIRGWFQDAPASIDEQLQFLGQVQKVSPLLISRIADHQRQQASQNARQQKNQARYSMKFVEDQSFRITDYINASQCKQIGRDLAAPCPVCRQEGRDKHGDNLRISPNGKYCCVLGGPGQVHRQVDIRRVLVLGYYR